MPMRERRLANGSTRKPDGLAGSRCRATRVTTLGGTPAASLIRRNPDRGDHSDRAESAIAQRAASALVMLC